MIKVNKLGLAFAIENYPLLMDAVLSIEGLSKEQKELVAGLCLEIALISDGTPDIFMDELPEDIINEDYD